MPQRGVLGMVPGEIITTDNGYADHVALVAEVSADGASLTTIEGNVGGCVVRKQHALDEAGLLGFGILPEQEDNGETPEEPAEPETPARTPLCGHEAHTHTTDCYDETGALICALCWRALGGNAAMLFGAAVVVVLRLLAAYYHWNLPRSDYHESGEEASTH